MMCECKLRSPKLVDYLAKREEMRSAATNPNDIGFFDPLDDDMKPIGDEEKNLTLASMTRGKNKNDKAKQFEKEFFALIEKELGATELARKKRNMAYGSKEQGQDGSDDEDHNDASQPGTSSGGPSKTKGKGKGKSSGKSHETVKERGSRRSKSSSKSKERSRSGSRKSKESTGKSRKDRGPTKK